MARGAECVIIGAGFAGVSTAWALARAGMRSSLILEREFSYGTHASGRNAGLIRIAEEDPLIRALALRSLDYLRHFERDGQPIVRPTGALTLAKRADGEALAARDA